MERVVRVVALVALVCAVLPCAASSTLAPEPSYRPSFPPAAQQRSAVARAFAARAPVYCGGGNVHAVALTFDDGPGPYTETLLRELRAAGAHATFFLVGNRLRYWPWAPRQEAALGAVGNHSWSHPRLTDMPRWLEWVELARTQAALAAADGRKPTLFRAPYELHDASTDFVARELGLTEVYWSVASGDDQPGASVARVERNVIAGLRPGAIILMHDIHPWTVEAMPVILHALAARGLQAVSVPELLALDPPQPGQEGCPVAPGTD
jgi:peptidoglycan/xylan/chitin deacetylase (PgdA/CDA1 family)